MPTRCCTRRRAPTKAEVFGYYTAIAEVMLPHIAGRPVTRKRWPNGVDEPAFFEKQLASSAPDWLNRGTDHAQVGHHHLPDHRQPATDWRGSPSRRRWKCTCRSGGSWQLKARVRRRAWCSTSIPVTDVTMPQLCDVARAIRDLMDRHRADHVSR